MALQRFVTNPTYRQTLSIDIDAAPEAIFPWLLQMGYQRGGLYSYDWLDRLFGFLDRPSANVILPAFQELRAGDVIPIGRGGGFPVVEVDRNRLLVMAGSQDDVVWGWELTLEAIGDGRTLLTSRNLARTPASWKSRAFLALLRPAAFIMTRRMLRGIKKRAEALAAASVAPLGRVA